MNRIFDDNRELQYDYVATFEAIAATVADVALNFIDTFTCYCAGFAVLYATHDDEAVTETSHFHVSKSVSDKTEGMLIAINKDEWDELIPSTTRGLASLLKKISGTIDLAQFRKSRRGPKKKQSHRSRNVASSHVSTAKLLGLAI